jgi:hypothetical protein
VEVCRASLEQRFQLGVDAKLGFTVLNEHLSNEIAILAGLTTHKSIVAADDE